MFGYAATYDLDHVPIAIYDQDTSEASRDLVAQFLGSPTFRLVATLHSGQRIDGLIDSRRVALVLVIDPRFTRDLLTGAGARAGDRRRPQLQHRAADQGYANSILSDFSLAWGAAHGGRGAAGSCSPCAPATTRP